MKAILYPIMIKRGFTKGITIQTVYIFYHMLL